MITENDIKYAQRLRGLRLNQGYKQETLSEILGLQNQQEYSKLENGKLNFTDELISKISKAFKISPSEFVNPTLYNNFNNSPQSNTQNSFNNNEGFVNQLLKAKDETIITQKELIEHLKKEINDLKEKRC
ncbi:MAG: helix-turn-helix domain-containing protein [Bacteroidetes bacterium]|nr:helix-turn-helix domain-containing protein [Bacteroidota bacterium]